VSLPRILRRQRNASFSGFFQGCNLGDMLNTGDTAWMLVSTALVLLMMPGLALFYGGLVRSKNVLSTFMHSFVVLGLVTLQWAAFGYSLAFGPDHGGIIGGLGYAFMNGVTLAPRAGDSIPHMLFFAYQMMFAIITPALISGAYAERMKFSAYALFTVLWATLIYDPLAHWVWGNGGWLGKLGVLDFAGGIVVHISSGVSALVVALVVGKRLGYPRERSIPHNLTMVLLGAGILWFGWFGFNGGSAGAASGTAVLALVNSQRAAAAGGMAWLIVDVVRYGKASALGFASGLVAGLATVTPASGFVGPMGAIAIGTAAGLGCYFAVTLKGRFGYDDTLDAFGVHGVGGSLGTILLGVFAAKAWNSGGADGLLAGGAAFLGKQVLAVLVSIAFSVVGTLVILKLVDVTVGLRVTPDEEREGLDINLHGEEGYSIGNSSFGRPETFAASQLAEPAPKGSPLPVAGA
jgi:Amt family ammonium transporter